MAKQKSILIIASALLIAFGIFFTFFSRTQFYTIIEFPFRFYLQAISFTGSHILSLFGLPVTWGESGYITATGVEVLFNSKILLKKWIVSIALLIFFTPISKRQKLKGISAFFLFHFVTILMNILLLTYLRSVGFRALDAGLIAKSLAYLLLCLFIVYWVSTNKIILKKIAAYSKLNHQYLLRKLRASMILVVTFIALVTFVGIYHFLPWINFIFNCSSQILFWFGHISLVEPFYLVGENVDIFMAKGCLGIQTSFVFLAFIWLTGEKMKPKLLYGLIGLLVINLVNILRFVFLFIHLQNHGEYLWNMEVHDMFNMMVYGVVLILWIIWIEYYTDIWPYLKEQKGSKPITASEFV